MSKKIASNKSLSIEDMLQTYNDAVNTMAIIIKVLTAAVGICSEPCGYMVKRGIVSACEILDEQFISISSRLNEYEKSFKQSDTLMRYARAMFECKLANDVWNVKDIHDASDDDQLAMVDSAEMLADCLVNNYLDLFLYADIYKTFNNKSQYDTPDNILFEIAYEFKIDHDNE